MKIIANENIYPLDSQSCHASHFVILPDSSVFAVWFYGSREGADDVCIFGARKQAGESVWSEPVRLTPDDNEPHWNPVLHLCPDGSAMLFYKTGKTISDWRTMVMYSTDGCLSFSEPRELVLGDDSGGRGPVRNKIITLSDGSLLAGGSTEKDEWICFADRSTDGGISWNRSADIRIPASYLSRYESVKGRGVIQPTLWESVPGVVHMLVRSTEGKVFRADSDDYGRTWSALYEFALLNNNSGIDIDRDESGRLYLVCNPVGLDEGKRFGKRTPLSVLVSDDNGKSFSKLTDIATGAGTFAYPCVRFSGDKLHITYTWNRKLIQYFCLDLDRKKD